MMDNKKIKIYLIVGIVGVLAAVVYLFFPLKSTAPTITIEKKTSNYQKIAKKKSALPSAADQTVVPTAKPIGVAVNPKTASAAKVVKTNTATVPANTLIIKKIGVGAKIQTVSFDGAGNMASPLNAKDVVWYSQSAKIGSNGNVVVSGHKDTTFGRAVFYNLSKLNAGDEVLISDDQAKVYKYVVAKKENYPIGSFPTESVFSNSRGPELNLITCTGKYDKQAKTYTERIVVTAKPQR